MKEGLYSLDKYPVHPVFGYTKRFCTQSSKEHAMSLWKDEENPDKIGFNREP